MTRTITENSLKPLSTSESFARGRELYLSGAVFDTFRQGYLLIGRCTGSSASFYHLSVQLDEGGILDASCTCPYNCGYCKHIIALLLTYIHDPEVFVDLFLLNENLRTMNIGK
jgi:uncharacterized Zn finger protein